MSRPESEGPWRLSAQLHLDYANDPLVVEASAGDAGSERAVIVAHHLVGTLGVALGLGERVTVFGGLPVTALMSGDASPSLGGQPLIEADGPGVGDLRLGARLHALGDAEGVSLGVQGTLMLPTALWIDDGQRLRGAEGVAFAPEVLLGLPAGPVRVLVNVGTLVRGESAASDSNLAFGSELTWGVGGVLPLWRDGDGTLEGSAQVYGASALEGLLERERSPMEGIAGVTWRGVGGWSWGVAAGPGITRGIGSPDLRAVATLGWSAPEAPPDTDGDGLNDRDDGCPEAAEDRDGFEDQDGCPDPDNDRDGVLDPEDRCPQEAEVVNGFEDADGCPDAIPDQDRDGLLDPEDACPEEPEDRDGFEDQDGCPDPDNDQDGVPDATDNCPNVPGVPARQGCEEEQQVKITPRQLEIIDTIYFKFDKDEILPQSFGLLKNVADVIKAHPEFSKIRVEGHTDARGSREYNLDLSRRRARSVVRWLVEEGGVEASRLESAGFGFDRQRVSGASTPEEHAQNRRVEFHIIGAEGVVEPSGNKATPDSVDR